MKFIPVHFPPVPPQDRFAFLRTFAPTELKNDCACVTSDPVGKAVGAKISTWATHSQWKSIESLDFAVKFQSVFRYETVVFRRYVLALLLVALLWKFEAYLVYTSLIWGKLPRRFLCFQKFCLFGYMFPGFPARISDMRNRYSARSFAPIATAHRYYVRKFTSHVMHWAQVLRNKLSNDREDGHCYSFAWI